jgi:hypothetical protein
MTGQTQGGCLTVVATLGGRCVLGTEQGAEPVTRFAPIVYSAGVGRAGSRRTADI